MTHHEDSPPATPYRSVFERAQDICMAARKARARHAYNVFGAAVEAERKAALACPYQVHHGLYQGKVEGFAEFADALACFIDHLADGGGSAWYAPKLLGESHDDKSTGLTDDENEAAELAQAVG
ncbi:MAG TPA: hypothetical protein VER11_34245 [Polyangiaceae bacterium]|nr:hypothetical protein [Polyangiaceae bacterium]